MGHTRDSNGAAPFAALQVPTRRFAAVLAVARTWTTPRQAAEILLQAVIESEIEGQNPLTDPAVLLMAGLVAFAMHADVATPGTYQKLHELCLHRAAESEGAASLQPH